MVLGDGLTGFLAHSLVAQDGLYLPRVAGAAFAGVQPERLDDLADLVGDAPPNP